MTTTSDTKAKPGWKTAIPILLPFVVIGMALWQFTRIPNYPWPTRELPADWTPGCDEWEVEWQTIRIGEVEPSSIRVEGWVEGHPGEVYLMKAQGIRTPYTLSRFSLITGEELAVASDLDPNARLEVKGWLGMCQRLMLGQQEIGITLRDPLTLQVVEAVTFNTDALPAVAAGATRSFFVAGHLDSGQWAGIFRDEVKNSKDEPTFWFLATPAGRVVQHKQIPKLDGWRPFPDEHPTVMLARTAYDDSATTIAVSLQTGDPVEVPPEALELFKASPDARDHVPCIATLPFSRVALKSHREVHSFGALLPEYSQQLGAADPTLMQEIPAPKSTAEEWAIKIARGRYDIWERLYPHERLQEIGVRTLRLEIIGIFGWSEIIGEERALTGDLLETSRIEASAQIHELWQSGGIDPIAKGTGFNGSPQGAHEVRERTLLQHLNCSFWPQEDGTILIQQLLFALPARYRTDVPIWRLGMLSPGASEVTWLGWIPAPPGESRPIPDIWDPSAGNLRFRRVDDQLILYRDGRRSGDPQPNPSPQDFAWAVVPLPPELKDVMKEPDA